jgi:cobalt-zinc-cadmium efflux system membrane fusion protein
MLIVYALAALTLAGCRDTRPRQPAEEGELSSAHVEAPRDRDELLRIEPGMLRDVRTTNAAVESRTGAAEVSMLGELTVNQDTYTEVASPIDAQVVRLMVGANARVDAGQGLAELRSPELGRARADLLAAQSRVTLAAQTLERKRALAADRIIAAREVEGVEASLREAEASRRAAEAAIRALGVAILDEPIAGDPSRFVLRAPLNGTVLERRGAVGQQASPSSPLYRIADLSRVWLIVHAFERDAVRIRSGASARVTLAAFPGRQFEGRVSAIGREVESVSRSVDVRIELPNPSGELRPGMSATAFIPVGDDRRMLLTVPVAALQRVGENWVVFLQRDEGAFEIRTVGRGRDLGAEVEIVSGLQADEEVVVEGSFLLKAEAEKTRGGAEHDH